MVRERNWHHPSLLLAAAVAELGFVCPQLGDVLKTGCYLWSWIYRSVLAAIRYDKNIYRNSSAGSHVARAFAASPAVKRLQIVLASRDPTSIHDKLSKEIADSLAPPAAVDITKRDSLRNPFEGADVVVSLVGVLMGPPATFDQVQWKGAENVALVAREQNAKLIHISAIGADPNSPLPSPRTKALGEQAVLAACPNATIFRPSLVFGPGDSFFMVRVPLMHQSGRTK